MIIADLNYLEMATQANLQGGTFASAGSSASGFGLFISVGTGAKTKSTSIGWFYRSSKASTYGYASAIAGSVSSSSYAHSAA
jgi:hypothetical protein